MEGSIIQNQLLKQDKKAKTFVCSKKMKREGNSMKLFIYVQRNK